MSDQDILTNDRTVTMTATGGETTLPADFPIYDQNEITVKRTRAGVTTTLSIATDYSVSGVGGASFNVLLVIPAAAADQYLIDGSTVVQRVGSYTQNNFKAGAVNRELDRVNMIEQELRRDLDRANLSNTTAAQSASDAAASANRAGLERRRATAARAGAQGSAQNANDRALEALDRLENTLAAAYRAAAHQHATIAKFRQLINSAQAQISAAQTFMANGANLFRRAKQQAAALTDDQIMLRSQVFS